MNTYIFKGKDNKNYIKLYVDNNNVVWIDQYYIDDSNEEYIKEFCIKICEGFNEMKTKKNALTHRQYISKIEFNKYEFLQNDDRWELVDDVEEYLLMECDINDAPKCIIEAFVGDFLF